MSLWQYLDDGAGFRGDAETGSMYFARELEHKKNRSFDVTKAPLRAFNLIPTDFTADRGAKTIVYEQYDMTGMAKIISNYADDLPRVDVSGKEFVARIKVVGDAYGYNAEDIRNAQAAGKSIDQRKAEAAVRKMREEWNRIAFYGDAEHGLQGWLTNDNIPADAVANDGTGDATGWDTKTPDQILRDMNDLANGIVERTNGAEQPDTLVLPIEKYTKITTTNAGTGTDTTIAEYFLRNNPFIEGIEWSNEITAANRAKFMEADPFTGEIMIAYRRSADAFTLEIPMLFQQRPPQERNLEFIINCESKIAGVLVYYPLSMAIGEGI